MQSSDRIYVAGHSGMVGAAICRALAREGYGNIVTRTHAELPLDDQAATRAFFAGDAIDYVFLAAARVGGIMANARFGADFIRDNLLIQTNVIDGAWRSGVKKLLFLASSCIYPRHAEQPIREESLLSGPLEPTNRSYAVAKIAGIEMCDAYRHQFGFDAISAMPSNVYGEGDNFDPETSHVVAGMMRRLHEAKLAGAASVTMWGTGSPLRELIHCDDLGGACLLLMRDYSDHGPINIGSGEEVSVRALAETIADIVGFEGRIVWDAGKPDGTPRKLMDQARIGALGWRPSIGLREGLERTYGWWLRRPELERGEEAVAHAD